MLSIVLNFVIAAKSSVAKYRIRGRTSEGRRIAAYLEIFDGAAAVLPGHRVGVDPRRHAAVHAALDGEDAARAGRQGEHLDGGGGEKEERQFSKLGHFEIPDGAKILVTSSPCHYFFF